MKELLGAISLLLLSISCQSGETRTSMNQSPTRQDGIVRPEIGELCTRLAEIKVMPMKGEPVNDEVYNRIIESSESAIPCLIDRVTDTTPMKDPRKAPRYLDFKVGDAAFFMLFEITKVPFEEMLPEEALDQWLEEGIYAYFEYVKKDDHRRVLQDKWKARFQTRKDPGAR